MNVGSLFAGIGGFELGLERAGFEVEWQVEVDPFCREVLAEHFPEARRFEDVKEVGAEELGSVDVICGGFPCQDLSFAGKGAGIDGTRSGLWSEFARIVCEIRPSYVLVENVPALLTGRGKRWERAPIGRVLGDLAEVGYDAEWACLSAREFGAPHLRKRVWIVAYPGDGISDTQHKGTGHLALRGGGRQGRKSTRASESALLREEDGEGRPENAGAHSPDLADADGEGSQRGLPPRSSTRGRRRSCDAGAEARVAADTYRRRGEDRCRLPEGEGRQAPPHTHPRRLAGDGRQAARPGEQWAAEPDVGRVAHGVSGRVDRLAALGNALVPQIAEWIGQRIRACEAAAMTSVEIHPEVRPRVRQKVHPEVRRDLRRTRPIARRGTDRGRSKTLRSPRHIEADS